MEFRSLPAVTDKPAKAPFLGAVTLDLASGSSLDAIEDLSSLLTPQLEVGTAMQLTAAAVARETLASTYLGHEIALPHARLSDPAPFCVVLGRAPQGIKWGPAGDSVRLVFMTLVPASCATDYLSFIRTLAHTIRDEAKLRALFEAKDLDAAKAWIRKHLAIS